MKPLIHQQNILRYITVDPAVCHGKPCFTRTRILVHLVLDLLEEGVPVEEIIGPRYYPQLTREHVAAALRYASELMSTRAYAV